MVSKHNELRKRLHVYFNIQSIAYAPPKTFLFGIIWSILAHAVDPVSFNLDYDVMSILFDPCLKLSILNGEGEGEVSVFSAKR